MNRQLVELLEYQPRTLPRNELSERVAIIVWENYKDQLKLESPDSDVTNAELYTAYYAFCARKGWLADSSNEFNKVLPELMLELRQCHPRKDIEREGKDQRGFSGVTTQTEAQ